MTDEKNISLEENHLIAERRTKLSAIRQRGNAFPNNFRPDSFTDALQTELGAKTKEELEALHRTASVAGRIMAKRGPFLVLQDMAERIQLYIDKTHAQAEEIKS